MSKTAQTQINQIKCISCKGHKSQSEFKIRKNGSVNKTCEGCLKPKRKNKTIKKEMTKIDVFATLPDELLYLISEKLENVVDLVSLSSTNKRFNRICKDSKFNEDHHEVYDITQYKCDTMYQYMNFRGMTAEGIEEIKDDNENENAFMSHLYSIKALKFNKTLKLKIDLSGYTRIKDVSYLGNVHTLNLEGCRGVTDVSALGNVNTLDISDTKVKDISMLENVEILTHSLNDTEDEYDFDDNESIYGHAD
jgi:hypothetical protein